MKKIIIALLTCMILVLGIGYLTQSDDLKEKLIQSIELEEEQVLNSNTLYWYHKLNQEEQKIYRIIAKGIDDLEKTITIDYAKNINIENYKGKVERVFEAFSADHPEIFYIGNTYEISVSNLLALYKVDLKMEYISNNVLEIQQMKTKLDYEVEKIVEDIEGYTTDYEKELAVHDILAKNIVYFENENIDDIPREKHTAYEALVNKSAVCDGITKAFQLVLDKLEIKSIFVTGITDDEPHAWCKVRLDNEYYNVDVTSDKTLNDEDNRLVIHSYFNITDKEIMKTHTFNNYDKFPIADAKKYNYYAYNDFTITHIDSFDYKIKEIARKQLAASLLEFQIIGVNNAASQMVNSLYNMNFNNYKSNNITKIEYVRINDNYIVVK